MSLTSSDITVQMLTARRSQFNSYMPADSPFRLSRMETKYELRETELRLLRGAV